MLFVDVKGDDWKFFVDVFNVCLDLDGDGSLEDEEMFVSIVSGLLCCVGVVLIEVDEIVFD